MNKSKIDWCDYTWNPVTGCLNDCKYCYARKIASRFRDKSFDEKAHHCSDDCIFATSIRPKTPYPYGFRPTFHEYRLDEPKGIKIPSNIFVCSMADLFGNWVPDKWIERVFEACKITPWHRFLFLTKNPRRYIDLAKAGKLPKNHYYGWTVTGRSDTHRNSLYQEYNTFVSFEPLTEYTGYFDLCKNAIVKWAIIGAETGNRKGKVVPKLDWVLDIAAGCRLRGIPVFMKNNLRDICGEELKLIQEYPKELEEVKC